MSEEEQIILPDGFRRVKYLEASGTQYINTNYIPSNTTGLYVKAVQDISGDGVALASMANNSTHFFVARMPKDTSTSIGYGWGGWYVWEYATHGSVIHEAQTNFYNDRKAQISVEDKILYKTENLPTLSFTPTYSLWLFGANTAGKLSRPWKGKIYEAKITENNELKMHFIPCIDNYNIPCMYDLVTQQPFYNRGSGMFLTNKSYEWGYPYLNNSYNLPAGFKKCVYLQSDGTQYIDLDVYPNNETGLLIKAMAMDEANGCPMGSNNTTPYIYPPRKILSSNKQIAYAWNKWYDSSVLLNWDKAGDLEYTSFVNYFNSRMVYFNSEDSDIIKQMNNDTLPQLETNVRLFNWGVESSMLNSPWIGRIYRAQITQGDTLIHDYVPCLDADNRPCMYDLIVQEALYNQSGGTEFSYCVEHQIPSDFIKLKYLVSSGTQYIKTGYVPTNNTGLYIDAYCVINGGTNGVESGVPMSIRETNGNTYVSAPRLGKTDGQQTGYGWNSFTTVGGYGDSRYEGYLNWLNDKKYNVKSSLYVEKVGNLTNLSFTPSFDLCMFGNHDYDGRYVGSGYRIYRAKISEGDQIVRDFVPAFDQVKLKPCMYDLINNVAYYNDGEGEFLYNNDFEGTYTGFGVLSGIGNRLGYFTEKNADDIENYLLLNENECIISEIIPEFGYKIEMDCFIQKSDDEDTGRALMYYSDNTGKILVIGATTIENGSITLLAQNNGIGGTTKAVVNERGKYYIETSIDNADIKFNNTSVFTYRGAVTMNGLGLRPFTSSLYFYYAPGVINNTTIIIYDIKVYDTESNIISHMIPLEENGQKGLYCTIRNIFLPVQSY